VYGRSGRWLAAWSIRLIAICVFLYLLYLIMGELWSVVLPVMLAAIVCTVLWPPVRWLRQHRVPGALATLLVMLVAFLILGGIIAAIAPSIVSQSGQLADKATSGLHKVQLWVQGPPLNLGAAQINSMVTSITNKLQSSAQTIATGVFSGVSAAGEAVISLVLVLMLTFFFLKDGDRFLPWLQRHSGSPLAEHLEEVCGRAWSTLGGFVRTQAVVALIDAFFIGLGLVLLHVPLAYALAIVTFLGCFIPILGAFVAGSMSVLVALVSNGPVNALLVMAVVVAVQQLDGNVLSPVLQSRSMNLHPVVVLLAVILGGTKFGIIGAFLAVPVAATVAVLMRYLGEQMDQAIGNDDVSHDLADLITDSPDSDPGAPALAEHPDADSDS
jgi:predicted PurR-regulated permease PerM